MTRVPVHPPESEVSKHTDVDTLISLIYSAADDTSQWKNVIEHVAHATGSRLGFVFLIDLSKGGHDKRQIVWQDYWGVSADVWQEMQTFPPNPFALRRHSVAAHGTALGSSIIEQEAYWASEYYRATSAHVDMGRLLGQVLNAGNGSFGSFTLWRSRTDPDYNHADYDLLTRLAPHLRRSALLAVKFSALHAERKMLRATAEALPLGVILLDGNGRPIYLNEAAKSVLGPIPKHTIGTTFQSKFLSGNLEVDSVLTAPLNLPSGPQIATVIPLSRGTGRFTNIAPEARTAVLFRTRAERGETLALSMQQAWELTPAEADLALSLLAGISLQQHAEKRGVTITTVRTHLRNCKSKLGLSKMNELIAFLAQHTL